MSGQVKELNTQAHTKSKEVRWVEWKAGDIPERPAEVAWAVAGIIARRGAVELFGAPGSQKSHIAISWALAVASGRGWWMKGLGREVSCVSGPTMYVTDEIGDVEAAGRLVKRAGWDRIPPDMSIVPARGQRIFTIGERKRVIPGANGIGIETHIEYVAALTPFGERLEKEIKERGVVLAGIDSATALFGGMEGGEQAKMYAGASFMERWGRKLNCVFVIVAHTSQDSARNWSPRDRLHYSARTGSAGAPAGYSYMVGATLWRVDRELEDIAREIGVDRAQGDPSFIFLACSKWRDGERLASEQKPLLLRSSASLGEFEVEQWNLDISLSGKRRRGSSSGARGLSKTPPPPTGDTSDD